MGLGGVAAALSGAGAAEAASLAVAISGKTVTDFGVEPGASFDQSAAMQEAIDRLAAAGQPIVIPAGHYQVAKLRLPSKATVLGVPGLSVLIAPPGLSALESLNAQDISLRGM